MEDGMEIGTNVYAIKKIGKMGVKGIALEGL